MVGECAAPGAGADADDDDGLREEGEERKEEGEARPGESRPRRGESSITCMVAMLAGGDQCQDITPEGCQRPRPRWARCAGSFETCEARRKMRSFLARYSRLPLRACTARAVHNSGCRVESTINARDPSNAACKGRYLRKRWFSTDIALSLALPSAPASVVQRPTNPRGEEAARAVSSGCRG